MAHGSRTLARANDSILPTISVAMGGPFCRPALASSADSISETKLVTVAAVMAGLSVVPSAETGFSGVSKAEPAILVAPCVVTSTMFL